MEKVVKPFLFGLWMLLAGILVYKYFTGNVPLRDYPHLIQKWLSLLGPWGPIFYIIFSFSIFILSLALVRIIKNRKQH